ncbi:uncharacterized protein LOC121410429 isoform X2 [Lytechinus variegatus]|uniref:uncharacterized protein LOC121410429 isoform X2 n=1 Tax=Lytechinus variegatus TaxID=7654 RepID=UPI001BB17357|nr:uncharacterized protein LOC121410429 isoform X2 [Lytechinus variegatus]
MVLRKRYSWERGKRTSQRCKELKATATALQDAINKLQHEYKRLSQITIGSGDEEQDPNKLSTSEQKLVRLCSRNRRCLSRLMAVEWDADKKSESSSIVSSELSSEDISPSSDPLDSDESTDSPPNGPTRREYTREYSLRDSGNGDSGDSGIYRRDSDRSHKLDTSNCGDLDTINEEDLSAIMRPKTIVTDLETCKDFVQSLAEQVQAMQEALRKSKDDLLEVDEEELEEERDMVVDGMEEVVKHDNDRVPEVEDIYETTPMVEVRVNSERNEGHQHDGHQNGGNIFWESEPLSVRERVMQIDRATLGREHRLSYRGRSSPIERDSYASRESHFSLLSHESHSSHLSRGSQESHQSLKSSLDSHASHASFGHHELHGTFDLPGMRESYSSHGSNKSYDSKSSSLVNGDHSPIPKRISNESQPRDRSRGTPSPPPSKFTNGPLRSSNPVNNVQKITNGTTSQSNTNGTSGKPRPPARQNIPPTKPIPPARPNGITKMNGQSLPNGVVKPARTSGPPIRSTPTSQVVDDGGYETPIQCKPIPPARNMAGQKQRSSHVQADYEEVIQLPGNVCDNQTTGLCVRTSKKDDYIHVSSTYEVTDIQATGNQPSRNDSDKSTNGTSNGVQRTVAEEGAIYEFPPDTCLEEEVPRPVSAMEEEPPKECFEEHIPPEPVIYKYDGPEVFGDNIKTEPARFEERDAIKKWDPVPLLRELYSNVQRHKDQTTGQRYSRNDSSPKSNRAGEISMEGYMEKLPMGRRRASLIKKWKKRYFRAKAGNLFYYEDHKAKKSLGYIHLIGGKVTEISNKVLEVTDMRGRVLLLRCNSKMEFEDWKNILTAETGAFVPKSNIAPPISKRVLVVDLGGSSVRAGVLSESETPYPQVFFPCVAATQGRSKDKTAYGFNALAPDCRATSKLHFPFRKQAKLEQFKLNMSITEGLLETAFSELCVDPIAYTVLVIVPFYMGPKMTEKLVEMIFDRFNVEGILVQEQALMALYSYKATSGIVVNIGERVDIVPIVDGYIVEKGVYRLPFGGRQITEHLTRLLTETGHRLFSEVEKYIGRLLKEKACFVAQDYHAELKFCSLDPELCSTYLDLDKYDVPNGTGTIKLDYSRFRCTEGLFHPEVWGKDHPGLHTLVYNAIQACNIEQRKTMAKSIYLCGGTTLLPGIAERLRTELTKMLPKSTLVKVHAAPERYHAAYNGANVLAPLSAFDNMCITKEEWRQLGPTSLTKWTTS